MPARVPLGSFNELIAQIDQAFGGIKGFEYNREQIDVGGNDVVRMNYRYGKNTWQTADIYPGLMHEAMRDQRTYMLRSEKGSYMTVGASIHASRAESGGVQATMSTPADNLINIIMDSAFTERSALDVAISGSQSVVGGALNVGGIHRESAARNFASRISVGFGSNIRPDEFTSSWGSQTWREQNLGQYADVFGHYVPSSAKGEQFRLQPATRSYEGVPVEDNKLSPKHMSVKGNLRGVVDLNVVKDNRVVRRQPSIIEKSGYLPTYARANITHTGEQDPRNVLVENKLIVPDMPFNQGGAIFSNRTSAVLENTIATYDTTKAFNLGIQTGDEARSIKIDLNKEAVGHMVRPGETYNVGTATYEYVDDAGAYQTRTEKLSVTAKNSNTIVQEIRLNIPPGIDANAKAGEQWRGLPEGNMSTANIVSGLQTQHGNAVNVTNLGTEQGPTIHVGTSVQTSISRKNEGQKLGGVHTGASVFSPDQQTSDVWGEGSHSRVDVVTGGVKSYPEQMLAAIRVYGPEERRDFFQHLAKTTQNEGFQRVSKYISGQPLQTDGQPTVLNMDRLAKEYGASPVQLGADIFKRILNPQSEKEEQLFAQKYNIGYSSGEVKMPVSGDTKQLYLSTMEKMGLPDKVIKDFIQFEEMPNGEYMARYKARGVRLRAGSSLVPEYGGKSTANMAVMEAVNAKYPEAARSLGLMPGNIPEDTGKMSPSQQSWRQIYKSWQYNQSERYAAPEESYVVSGKQNRSRVVKEYETLTNITGDTGLNAEEKLQRVKAEMFGSNMPFFENTETVLPAPDAILGAESMEFGQSVTKLGPQYLNALEEHYVAELAPASYKSELYSSGKMAAKFDRMFSPEQGTMGRTTRHHLYGRQVPGAIGGRYQQMPTLNMREVYTPKDQLHRMLQDVGVPNKYLARAEQQLLEEGGMKGLFIRRPILSQQGAFAVNIVTEEILKERGVRNIPLATAIEGKTIRGGMAQANSLVGYTSADLPIGTEGDMDFDPGDSIPMARWDARSKRLVTLETGESFDKDLQSSTGEKIKQIDKTLRSTFGDMPEVGVLSHSIRDTLEAAGIAFDDKGMYVGGQIRDAKNLTAIGDAMLNVIHPDRKAVMENYRESVEPGKGRGTAYNMRRMLKSSAGVLGTFNPEDIAEGTDALGRVYQTYLDMLSSERTGIEKMLETATLNAHEGQEATISSQIQPSGSRKWSEYISSKVSREEVPTNVTRILASAATQGAKGILEPTALAFMFSTGSDDFHSLKGKLSGLGEAADITEVINEHLSTSDIFRTPIGTSLMTGAIHRAERKGRMLSDPGKILGNAPRVQAGKTTLGNRTYQELADDPLYKSVDIAYNKLYVGKSGITPDDIEVLQGQMQPDNPLLQQVQNQVGDPRLAYAHQRTRLGDSDIWDNPVKLGQQFALQTDFSINASEIGSLAKADPSQIPNTSEGMTRTGFPEQTLIRSTARHIGSSLVESSGLKYLLKAESPHLERGKRIDRMAGASGEMRSQFGTYIGQGKPLQESMQLGKRTVEVKGVPDFVSVDDKGIVITDVKSKADLASLDTTAGVASYKERYKPQLAAYGQVMQGMAFKNPAKLAEVLESWGMKDDIPQIIEHAKEGRIRGQLKVFGDTLEESVPVMQYDDIMSYDLAGSLRKGINNISAATMPTLDYFKTLAAQPEQTVQTSTGSTSLDMSKLSMNKFKQEIQDATMYSKRKWHVDKIAGRLGQLLGVASVGEAIGSMRKKGTAFAGGQVDSEKYENPFIPPWKPGVFADVTSEGEIETGIDTREVISEMAPDRVTTGEKGFVEKNEQGKPLGREETNEHGEVLTIAEQQAIAERQAKTLVDKINRYEWVTQNPRTIGEISEGMQSASQALRLYDATRSGDIGTVTKDLERFAKQANMGYDTDLSASENLAQITENLPNEQRAKLATVLGGHKSKLAAASKLQAYTQRFGRYTNYRDQLEGVAFNGEGEVINRDAAEEYNVAQQVISASQGQGAGASIQELANVKDVAGSAGFFSSRKDMVDMGVSVEKLVESFEKLTDAQQKHRETLSDSTVTLKEYNTARIDLKKAEAQFEHTVSTGREHMSRSMARQAETPEQRMTWMQEAQKYGKQSASAFEKMQDIAHEESLSPTARLGRSARSIFGGWGLHFIGATLGYGVKQASSGFQEAQQEEMRTRDVLRRMYGSSVGEKSQLELERGALVGYGGPFGTLVSAAKQKVYSNDALATGVAGIAGGVGGFAAASYIGKTVAGASGLATYAPVVGLGVGAAVGIGSIFGQGMKRDETLNKFTAGMLEGDWNATGWAGMALGSRRITGQDTGRSIEEDLTNRVPLALGFFGETKGIEGYYDKMAAMGVPIPSDFRESTKGITSRKVLETFGQDEYSMSEALILAEMGANDFEDDILSEYTNEAATVAYFKGAIAGLNPVEDATAIRQLADQYASGNVRTGDAVQFLQAVGRPITQSSITHTEAMLGSSQADVITEGMGTQVLQALGPTEAKRLFDKYNRPDALPGSGEDSDRWMMPSESDVLKFLGERATDPRFSYERQASKLSEWAESMGLSGFEMPEFTQMSEPGFVASLENQQILSKAQGIHQGIFAQTGNLGLADTVTETVAGWTGQAGQRAASLVQGLVGYDPSAIGYAVDQLGQNDLRSIQTTQWSRDNNGELMVGKWGTWSIDNTDMESIYGADWRDNDPTGVRKQLHEGGFQSIDAWVRQESYDLQKRSAGLSFASANLSYAFQTGIGLQGYNTINPQTGKAFDLPQGGFWGVQDKQFALQGRQQEYNFAYQERELALSDEYWHQNMGLQQRQAGMQRTWAQEDWAYQDQRRNLSWQWKQEDFQENVRFMTGRQRKLAERNMERDTIVQNLETEQIDTKRERQEELWALEDERFEINTNYHETQMAHQEERLDKMRQFYEEGRVLQKQQMELSKAYFIEQNALQRASAALQMDQAEFQKTIADDLEKARIEAENKQATLEAQQKTWTQTLTWIEKTLVDLPAKIKQKIEQELGITVGQVPYTGNWVGPGDRGEDSPRSERPNVNVYIDGEDIYSRTEQNIGDRL